MTDDSRWKWISRMKWWQMLILFPSILTILGGAAKGGYSFVYYTVLGNPVMGTVEKRNLQEFKNHFGEVPTRKEVIEVNGEVKVDVAYYSSDGCMLITRRSDEGDISMTWLPHIKDRLVTYSKVVPKRPILSVAYAADITEMSSVHDNDPRYKDVPVGWLNGYEFVVERRFVDGCVGSFRVFAPTGAVCCWQWLIYRHR